MEFELFFIKPTTITSTWRNTAKQILPQHIMSFSMTKNTFDRVLTNGGVASSTARLTVDNSSGEYTAYFGDKDYWLYVARPQEEITAGSREFIVSFHLDNVKVNEMQMVSVDCYDALDLLNQHTISSADIKAVVETPNAVFDDLYLLLDDMNDWGFTVEFDSGQDEIAIGSWTLTEDISYRQLIGWLAERFGGYYQPSGGYMPNRGEDIQLTNIITANTVYPKLPNSIPYAIYYDNADDPNRPVSFDSQTRDLETLTITGFRVYDYDTKEPRMIQGNDNGYVVEIKDNPFVTSTIPPSMIHSNLVGITTFRHTTNAVKEAFCKGYYYTDTTATQASLYDRYHALTMGFINHNPHTITVSGQEREVYGDVIISPLSTYNYNCNGTESISFDVESKTETEIVSPLSPTDMAIDDLYNQVTYPDTVTFSDSVQCAGIVTRSQKALLFTLPLVNADKYSITINSLSATAFGINGIIENSYSVPITQTALETPICTPLGIRLLLAKSTAWSSASNSTPITVLVNSINMTLTKL